MSKRSVHVFSVLLLATTLLLVLGDHMTTEAANFDGIFDERPARQADIFQERPAIYKPESFDERPAREADLSAEKSTDLDAVELDKREYLLHFFYCHL